MTEPPELLSRLADRAAAQPPLPAGPFDYLHTRGWLPTDTVLTDGPLPAGTPVPFGDPVPAGDEDWRESEAWSDADGRGRLRHWGNTTGDEVFDSGTDAPVDLERPPRAAHLPTDSAALEAALLALRTEPADISHLYDLMTRTWAHQVLDPPVQAAFLRLLATKDNVRVLGPATDRLGREGVAFATSEESTLGEARSRPTSTTAHTLIFDPQTGALLTDERVRIGPDGRLMLRSALALLHTGRVASIGERP